MPPSDTSERFSRQTILPSVGAEGQKKWSEASVFLAGEGLSLQSAATALASAGVSKLLIPALGIFDDSALASAFPGLKIDVLSEDMDQVPKASAFLILTENKKMRGRLSRLLRHQAKPALFGWPAGKGYALFAAPHRGGQCPCLECFEIMNPKAFSPGQPSIQRLLGALAASEILQWILKESTSLENKVWITSLESGTSFHHEVQPTYKCPARLLEEGAVVTP